MFSLFCFNEIIERPSKTVMLLSFTMMCFLWSCFASFGADENVLDRIKRSAEAGISVSQLTLANIYAEGKHGARKNTEAAIKWYRLSASSGNQDAQVLLADAIRQGIGVQKDINEAVIWYKLAAEKGNPLAYASLAQIYLENTDGLGNMKEALKWLKLGAKANDPYSQMRLGDAYLSGTFLILIFFDNIERFLMSK